MNVGWVKEMEEAIARAGDAPARVQLRGGVFVLLPADDYAWVRETVRGVPDVPLILDPARNNEYALLPLPDYERIKPLFEEDPITPEEQRQRLREAGLRAGWGDPEMGVYDDLDPRKQA